jgi:predicted O-linked N-acetylglucosamine transferase (SPINDLY family)
MPADALAWAGLGATLMEIELASPAARDVRPAPIERALAAFERAVALAPRSPSALAQLAMAARYACRWDRSAECVRALAELALDPATPLVVSPVMAAVLIEDPALQARAIADFSTQALPPAATRPPTAVRQRGSRLRVGYVSADFHEHATAQLAAGLFEHHDRARVTTFAYALDRDDGSAMRRRLVAAFDGWRDCAHADDVAVARAIADDALDVLVDLKGHTQDARPGILAKRPAPVQIHYLGFPGTLAYAAIDAQVADAIVVPAGDEIHYREAILRLPHCYQANDRKRPLPPAAARESVGLRNDAIVLVSFNQAYKLDRRFVALWLDALADHARAVLWLTVPHAIAREAILSEAAARGISGERIVFAPVARQVDHLARLRCADLALDVLPYGSHTTGSDALWCGVPLLTLTGRTFAGRVGTSLVTAAGLPQLAT